MSLTKEQMEVMADTANGLAQNLATDYPGWQAPIAIVGFVRRLISEVERLQARLLTAAGDDLCRLTQEEIKAMSAGTVKIPPKEEFLASCERFHAQVSGESGVMSNCLTLAQLVAECERLQAENVTMTAVVQAAKKWLDSRCVVWTGEPNGPGAKSYDPATERALEAAVAEWQKENQ